MKAELLGFRALNFSNESGENVTGATCYFKKENPTEGVEGHVAFKQFVPGSMIDSDSLVVGEVYFLDFEPGGKDGKAKLTEMFYAG